MKNSKKIVTGKNGRPLRKLQKGATPVSVYRELQRLSHLTVMAKD